MCNQSIHIFKGASCKNIKEQHSWGFYLFFKVNKSHQSAEGRHLTSKAPHCCRRYADSWPTDLNGRVGSAREQVMPGWQCEKGPLCVFWVGLVTSVVTLHGEKPTGHLLWPRLNKRRMSAVVTLVLINVAALFSLANAQFSLWTLQCCYMRNSSENTWMFGEHCQFGGRM